MMDVGISIQGFSADGMGIESDVCVMDRIEQDGVRTLQSFFLDVDLKRVLADRFD